MSLLGTQLLLQRILRKPTSSGGALTANSVNSSHIVDGSITGADLTNSISIAGALDVGFELNVTDQAYFLSSLTCNGDIFANGDIYAQNNINVGNQLTANITGFYENNSDYLTTKSAQFANFTTGTDKIHGTATLVGGTATITHSAATANSEYKVLVTRNNVVTANHMGHLYVVKATGSFQIVSTNSNDNNAVDWFFFKAN